MAGNGSRPWFSPFKVKGHLIENRKTEIITGLVLLIIAGVLIWDAFDNRGKKLPGPVGGLAFW